MFTISSNSITGNIKIFDSYSEDNYPTLSNIDEEYKLSFINLQNVKYFSSFTYKTIGESNDRYLSTNYRISKDNNAWTPWLALNATITNFPPFDPKYKMFIDIKWTRIGDSDTGDIKLLNYNLSGSLDRDIIDGTSTIKLNSTNNEIVIKPPYIFKIFKINDIEILSSGDIDNTSIKYRYSQDHGRSISELKEFTKENIKTERITPIRFFQIEYFVSYSGTSSVSIFDINIIGDFQNVTLDSQKTNLFGIREDCNCLMLNIIGDNTTLLNDNPGGNTSMLMGQYDINKSILPIMTKEDISKLYNPYQQAQALNLFNKLSNDTVNIFGHEVVYVLTDPDKNGIDYTFHEYQLQNYICDAKIKVSVDQNQFPDNSGSINNFDLTLFETFEINITKDTFKTAFGIDKRPGKDDFLWFCNLNKIYRVEHSHAIRNFNNYSIYYKIMLTKYNEKANIIGATQELQDMVNSLTKNSTLEELMGLENSQDKKAVADTEQFRTGSHDILRVDIFANIEKDKIDNSTIVISKSYYDLSSVTSGSDAIVYRNFKNFYKKSDNIGYMSWFNFNNLTMNDTYNFFNYYKDNNGYYISIVGNNILVKINGTTHTLQMSAATSNILEENVWYSIVVNLDQRLSLLTAYIYKRNVDYEEDAIMLGSSKLKQLYKIEKSITPDNMEMVDTSASILGSDMKLTNIRMFIDVIPETEHNKLLNLEVIGSDYKYIIFGDNANKNIILPFYTDSKVNYNKLRKGSGFSDA